MCFRFKTKPTIFSHDVVGHVGGVEFGLCGVVDLVGVLECVCRITLNSKVNRHEDRWITDIVEYVPHKRGTKRRVLSTNTIPMVI